MTTAALSRLIKDTISSIGLCKAARLKMKADLNAYGDWSVSLAQTDVSLSDDQLRKIIFEIALALKNFDIESVLFSCDEDIDSGRGRYVRLNLKNNFDLADVEISLNLGALERRVIEELKLHSPLEVMGATLVEYYGGNSIAITVPVEENFDQSDDNVKLFAYRIAESIARLQKTYANNFFVNITPPGKASYMVHVPLGLIFGTQGQILLSELKVNKSSGELICCGSGWGPLDDWITIEQT